jgi:hypothetical protein
MGPRYRPTPMKNLPFVGLKASLPFAKVPLWDEFKPLRFPKSFTFAPREGFVGPHFPALKIKFFSSL